MGGCVGGPGVLVAASAPRSEELPEAASKATPGARAGPGPRNGRASKQLGIREGLQRRIPIWEPSACRRPSCGRPAHLGKGPQCTGGPQLVSRPGVWRVCTLWLHLHCQSKTKQSPSALSLCIFFWKNLAKLSFKPEILIF